MARSGRSDSQNSSKRSRSRSITDRFRRRSKSTDPDSSLAELPSTGNDTYPSDSHRSNYDRDEFLRLQSQSVREIDTCCIDLNTTFGEDSGYAEMYLNWVSRHPDNTMTGLRDRNHDTRAISRWTREAYLMRLTSDDPLPQISHIMTAIERRREEELREEASARRGQRISTGRSRTSQARPDRSEGTATVEPPTPEDWLKTTAVALTLTGAYFAYKYLFGKSRAD